MTETTTAPGLASTPATNTGSLVVSALVGAAAGTAGFFAANAMGLGRIGRITGALVAGTGATLLVNRPHAVVQANSISMETSAQDTSLSR